MVSEFYFLAFYCYSKEIVNYIHHEFNGELRVSEQLYLCNLSAFVYLWCFSSGVLHHSGRPDLLLQERQTSLQETCSRPEDMNLGPSSHFSSHTFSLRRCGGKAS